MVFRIREPVRAAYTCNDAMPPEKIIYTRKRGCFITTIRGLFMTCTFIIVGIVILLFIYYYVGAENLTSSPLSFDQFLLENPYDKTERSEGISKNTVIPQKYEILLNLTDNRDDANANYKFNGTVCITISVTNNQTNKIELNIHNLDIQFHDVAIHHVGLISEIDSIKTSLCLADLDGKNRKSRSITNDTNVLNSNETSIDGIETNSSNESSLPDGKETVTLLDLDTADSKPISNEYPIKYDSSQNSGDDLSHEIPQDQLPDYQQSGNDWDIPKSDTIKIKSIQINGHRNIMEIYLNGYLSAQGVYNIKINYIGHGTRDRGILRTANSGNDIKHHVVAAVVDHNEASHIFPCFQDMKIFTDIELCLVFQTDETLIMDKNFYLVESIHGGIINTKLQRYRSTMPVKLTDINFIFTDIPFEVVELNSYISMKIYVRPSIKGLLKNFNMKMQKSFELYERFKNIEEEVNNLVIVIIPKIGSSLITYQNGVVLISEQKFAEICLVDAEDIFDTAFIFSLVLTERTLQREFNPNSWLIEALPYYTVFSVGLKNEYFNKEYLFNEKLMKIQHQGMKMDSTVSNESLIELSEIASSNKEYEFLKLKGASVLNMLRASLSNIYFDETVKIYMNRRHERKRINFFEELEEMLQENHIEKQFTVQGFISAWMSYRNYPVVNVYYDEKQQLIEIRQEHMHVPVKCCDTLPIIPLRLISNLNQIPNDIKWLNKNVLTIQNIPSLLTKDTYVLFEPIGYYRINYEPKIWHGILTLFNTQQELIPSVIRFKLLDDALVLAKYGKLSFNYAFKLLNIWRKEKKNLTEWRLIMENIKDIYEMSSDANNYLDFRGYLLRLIEVIQKDISERSNNNPVSIDFRIMLNDWGCKLGDKNAINDMKVAYQTITNQLQNKTHITMLEKEVYNILCSAIRYGDTEEWITVKEYARNSLYEESALMALGCTRNPILIHELLKFLTKPQSQYYISSILQSMHTNKVGISYVLDYLGRDFVPLTLHISLQQLMDVLVAIDNVNDYNKFKEIYIKNAPMFNEKQNVATLHKIHGHIEQNLLIRETVVSGIQATDWSQFQ